MKLNHLRDFLAVAERGSFRAAARHLNIAQPLLTRSIQELERELAVTLFERSARGVVVTRMGEVLMRRATAVQHEMRRIQEEIDQLRGRTHGRICVGMSSVPHIALLPLALWPFRQRYPEVYLDVIDGVLPVVEGGLRDGTVDCYIGPVAEAVSGELVVEKLFDNTRVILGRKGHPLQNARSLRDLVGAQWMSTSVMLNVEEELGPLFAERGLPRPKLIMQARSALTFIVALAYSDALAMLPVQWLEFPLTRDVLQKIDVVERIAAPPICIVQRAGLPLTPAAEFFCDMMRRAAARYQREGAPPQ